MSQTYTIDPARFTETVRQWVLEPGSVAQETAKTAIATAFDAVINDYSTPQNRIQYYPYQLGLALQRGFEAVYPIETGVFADMLSYALGGIDWDRIAGTVIDQIADFPDIETGLDQHIGDRCDALEAEI